MSELTMSIEHVQRKTIDAMKHAHLCEWKEYESAMIEAQVIFQKIKRDIETDAPVTDARGRT